MKTFLVNLTYEEIIIAESQEKAEEFFRDNMDLGSGKIKSEEIIEVLK